MSEFEPEYIVEVEITQNPREVREISEMYAAKAAATGDRHLAAIAESAKMDAMSLETAFPLTSKAYSDRSLAILKGL